MLRGMKLLILRTSYLVSLAFESICYAYVFFCRSELNALNGLKHAIAGDKIRNIIVEIVPIAWTSKGISLQQGIDFFESLAEQFTGTIVLEDVDFTKAIDGWNKDHATLPADVIGNIWWVPKGGMKTLIEDRNAKLRGMNVWFFKR